MILAIAIIILIRLLARPVREEDLQTFPAVMRFAAVSSIRLHLLLSGHRPCHPNQLKQGTVAP